MKTIVSMLFVAALFVTAALGQSERRVFSGSVGESKVEMTLTRTDSGALSGSYSYVRLGKPLNLAGSVDSEGNFTLVESVGGVKSGTFKGKWASSEEDGVVLTGTWTAAKTGKTADFSLGEQMIYFKGDARIITRSFVETSKPKLYEITADYPELSGVAPAIAAEFNRLAKKLVMDEVAKFRKDMMAQSPQDVRRMREMGMKNTSEAGYFVTYADDELISISFGNYLFTGGAHGSGYSFPLNFDLRTGKEIKLGELFKPKANYLQVISRYCVKELEEELNEGKEDEWIRQGAGPDPKNFESWNFKKAGLEITFDVYQVTAYAAGPQEVLIPYRELKSMMSKSFAVFGF